MAKFIPKLWSEELLVKMKESLIMADSLRPKRDKYSQMLRDKALGRPEFPEPRPELHRSYATNMTATEVRIRNEYAQHAADAMAYAIDNDVLDNLKRYLK